MFLVFALRHFYRHWAMNLVLALAMTLSTVVLGLLPLYLASIGAEQLTQSLSDAHALARNLEVVGKDLGSDEDTLLQDTLGSFLQERVEIRQSTLDAGQLVRLDGVESKASERLVLHLWSLEGLGENLRVLDGHLPSPREDTSAPLPVAVGERAAEDLGLHIGDTLDDVDGRIEVEVVGIIAPLDPHADRWWHDRTQRLFRTWRQGDPYGTDTIYLSLLANPIAMQRLSIEQNIHWRVLLNWDEISIDNTREIHARLTDLERQLGARFADLETGLPELLDRFHGHLDLAQIFLVLLAVQSMLAALYVLGTIGSFLLEQSRVELAVMTGRGFGRGHVTALFALESAVLALGIALPAGPLLAKGVSVLWSRWSGRPVPSSIPAASWWLAAAAALCGWLSLVVPLYASTRQNLLDWQRQQARPAPRARWQRLVLDLALLGLGLLAYWQLTQNDRLDWKFEGATLAADPVLLIGPSVLFLAIALLLLRLFPLLLSLARRLTEAVRRLVVPFGLTRLARRPQEPNQMILLISLAAGLVLFGTVLSDSVAQRQREIAQYVSGADLRVTLPLQDLEAQQVKDHIDSFGGVQATASVYRNTVLIDKGTSSSIQLVAADPDTLPLVTAFAPGVSERTVADVLADLSRSPGPGQPLLASPGALPVGSQAGDEVRYRMCGRKLTFVVAGTVSQWPTLSPPFVLADLSALQASGNITCGQRELWIAAAKGAYEDVLGNVKRLQEEMPGSVEVIADARRQLHTYETDLVAQTATAAFQINAVTLVILSSTSFLLLQVLALRRRLPQLGILRALGMSARQMVGLISLESAVAIVLGLGIGAGIGLILTHTMRTFLSFALAPSLGIYASEHFSIDWNHIAGTVLPMVGIDVLAMICLAIALLRTDLHRALRAVNE